MNVAHTILNAVCVWFLQISLATPAANLFLLVVLYLLRSAVSLHACTSPYPACVYFAASANYMGVAVKLGALIAVSLLFLLPTAQAFFLALFMEGVQCSCDGGFMQFMQSTFARHVY